MKGVTSVLLLCMLFWCALDCALSQEDFYDLLGIDRSATTKDIRKAFKKVALKMHPDKNVDDPEADSKFARINRAYEVLKDDDLRKKYDQFGEDGLEDSQSGHGFHSWSYYRDNFGIYDDDPEIITLSRTDFESSVSNSHTPWFINFYHPMCSHCHTLAPDWRWLSIELQGVVRIGAVNCDDEYHLCSEQGVQGYPSLLAYPGREKFRLDKTRDNLVDFILRRLPTGQGIPVTAGMIHNMKQQHKKRDETSLSEKKPWLLAAFFSRDELSQQTILLMKLAALFSGIVKVGRVDCSSETSLCSSLNISSSRGLSSFTFFPDLPILGSGSPVVSETAQDIARDVLELMPGVPLIDEQEYNRRQAELLEKTDSVGWLVQFTSENDHQDLELRKLPGLSFPIPTHRVLCSALSSNACDALYLSKTPAFVLFKAGGGYEMHHGRLLAQDIANFAREAAGAPQFRTLTPKEFPSVLSHSGHWFIDFYAPWCPPCMRLLPKFRKASILVQQQQLNSQINFGIIDCTTHGDLCSSYNVRSYPTTIFYNHTTPHLYKGPHAEGNFVEFIKDTLSPTVSSLTPESFTSLVLGRKPNEFWVVDFFASWCGPCLAMAPEFRKFGRLVQEHKNVFVATLDCAEYRDFCGRQGVSSYPSIRLYSKGAPGSYSQYQDYPRDATSFKRWLYSHFPSKVQSLNDRSFEEVLRSSAPWVVDFYADWCGHCRQFAPDFEDMANAFDGSVKFGKVDCQAFQWLCRSAQVGAYPTVIFYPGKGGTRQPPTGEMIDSISPERVRAYLARRLEQLGTRPRDEL